MFILGSQFQKFNSTIIRSESLPLSPSGKADHNGREAILEERNKDLVTYFLQSDSPPNTAIKFYPS